MSQPPDQTAGGTPPATRGWLLARMFVAMLAATGLCVLARPGLLCRVGVAPADAAGWGGVAWFTLLFALWYPLIRTARRSRPPRA